MFKAISKMMDRVEIARQDSDTSFFMHLLYAGELLTKVCTATLIAAIENDSDRHRYRLMHRLVRADGIGDWCGAMDEALIGPASQHLIAGAKAEQRIFTQKCTSGSWQYEAVSRIDECMRCIDVQREGLPHKVDLRRWFTTFAELRNKTRGHGAPSGSDCGRLSSLLEEAIKALIANTSLLHRQWAYLQRNLSGKYRVTALAEQSGEFDHLKSAKAASQGQNLIPGVYVSIDGPVRVDLIFSDAEALDFFLPNGAFNEKTFETISYLTGAVVVEDAAPYMAPATDLPASETQGLGVLDVQGKTFGNTPPSPKGYIERVDLQKELSERLVDERHPVVTLVGRGGIGKTSLALNVLHTLNQSERFGAILWFSARDIDLLPEGPKLVRAHLLGEKEVAREFARLTEPRGFGEKGFDSLKYFSQALTQSPIGLPLLFVFDNFETAQNPAELYTWLNTYIRNPNKILITTRFRDFKGDYPVDVYGMTEQESDRLIAATAERLDISHLLTDEYKRDLYRESDGHPYVIKVLLGEVAKAGKVVKIERIVASKEEILDALFERTYSGLSPFARQIFLTLCSWRSTIPQLAIEAAMFRTFQERMDLENAIEELRRCSFVEVAESEEDRQIFLTVPLVASVFGRRKLSVSPMKAAVDATMHLLLYFGAGQKLDIKRGIGPRVERLFATMAQKIQSDSGELSEYIPMLEYVAQRHAPAWLLLSSLYEESEVKGSVEKAKEAIRRYLEREINPSQRFLAWNRLAQLCRRTSDAIGEIHALVEAASNGVSPVSSISNALRRWNTLSKQQFLAIPGDEKQLLAWRLLEAAEHRSGELDANDCSMAAWMCLALREEERAKTFVQLGLNDDPRNEHCLKLAEKVGFQLDLSSEFRA